MELFGGQGANTCVNLQGFSDSELSTFNNGQIGMAPLEFEVLGGDTLVHPHDPCLLNI
jgi:hypothetical protein